MLVFPPTNVAERPQKSQGASTTATASLTGRSRCHPDVGRRVVVQALADRFVEAFAERLHADMRKEIWGYAPDEQASLSLECRLLLPSVTTKMKMCRLFC